MILLFDFEHEKNRQPKTKEKQRNEIFFILSSRKKTKKSGLPFFFIKSPIMKTARTDITDLMYLIYFEFIKK